MAFDNPAHNDGWKETVEEMSKTMVVMAQEIVKLREAMAPLLERHLREEEQRLRKEEQRLREEAARCMFQQQIKQQAQQYAAHLYTNQPYGICDCTPDRTSMLNSPGDYYSQYDPPRR